MPSTGDLRDPEWEPTDAEYEALREDFRRTVLWQAAMAAKGIKVLALGMTMAEQSAAMRKWWREEGEAQDKAQGIEKESPSR